MRKLSVGMWAKHEVAFETRNFFQSGAKIKRVDCSRLAASKKSVFCENRLNDFVLSSEAHTDSVRVTDYGSHVVAKLEVSSSEH